MWVTCAPLAWLLAATYTAALQKILSPLPRIGFLADAARLESALASGKVTAANIAETRTLIFNARLDAVVCALFLVLVTIVVLDSIRVWEGIIRGTRPAGVHEAPFLPTHLRPEDI
jgi:carbon starvation protein